MNTQISQGQNTLSSYLDELIQGSSLDKDETPGEKEI
jgi:hypothetical protein